jgi:hypothetical protein
VDHWEVRAQREEIVRRLSTYRGDRPLPAPAGRTVLVMDDGIATGFTFQTAPQGLRRPGAARLVAAVPDGPRESLAELLGLSDDVSCLASPAPFLMVGAWCRQFVRNSDEEFVALLQQEDTAPADVAEEAAIHGEPVIELNQVALERRHGPKEMAIVLGAGHRRGAEDAVSQQSRSMRGGVSHFTAPL